MARKIPRSSAATCGDGSVLILRPGNPMRNVLRAVLIFEVIVFGLAIPVMIFVSSVPGEAAALAGGGAALLALVSAGLLRRAAGFYVGWVTQAIGIALGFLTYGMLVVGIMFASLWLLTFVLGKRLEAQQRPS
jgi:hypothetical protein